MIKSSSLLTWTAAALFAVGASICGAQGTGSGFGGGGGDLSEEEAEHMEFMREEEKVARDTYLVLYEAWTLTVFTNISASEQSHMDAMLKLLNKYDLEDPAAGNGIGEFSDPYLQSLYDGLVAKGELSDLDALQVGGIIEETDMHDILDAIEHTDNADIVAVYENLLCGSRNHLRSFARNIEAMTGEPYEALTDALPQEEVDAIVNSPMENCGGG